MNAYSYNQDMKHDLIKQKQINDSHVN